MMICNIILQILYIMITFYPKMDPKVAIKVQVGVFGLCMF